ncbi:citrulline utilization hydrolase CtlX [Janthinobacterium sp.]|uniref:citrulline utilization hydrolase CtlX n=1 Tax=Janthinobacterium sp. TaxID=1871054 RepID=UPI00293D2A6B|nr:arginine deiminase-related protein [Janthinobacterium sp.]
MQTAQHVLMIRPAHFLSNPQTAASNAFQRGGVDDAAAQRAALSEFDAYVALLRGAGVGVVVVEDTPLPHTPDSIFPNNWVSFQGDGSALLYPMEAPNRRQERRLAVLAAVEREFRIGRVADLAHFEADARFLEGTGSMVLDHDARIAYVCHSTRSHPEAMAAFVAQTGYQPLWFHARDRAGVAIYHTNVMMCIGSTLALVCLEAIGDGEERARVVAALGAAGKEVLAISFAQMEDFAGNMLELRGAGGRPVFAMSRRAWAALDDHQRGRISACATPVLAPIETIERLGGGGARCMLAEIFLPRRTEAEAGAATYCAGTGRRPRTASK